MPPPSEVLCISYFSSILGPRVVYCTNPEIANYKHPDLEKILEFNDKPGSFIFAGLKYQTNNFLFYIDTKEVKSGKILVMITYMIRSSFFMKQISNVFKFLESTGVLLKELGKKMVQNVEKIVSFLFDFNGSSLEENITKISESPNFTYFSELLNEYLDKISEKKDLVFSTRKRSSKKIFIIGDRNTDTKNTFLRNLEVLQFHKQNNIDLPSRIFEVTIENMEILTYDCLRNDKFCFYCPNFKTCLENAEAFIIIFNQTNKESLLEAKSNLDLLLEKLDHSIPVLVIGNKMQNKKNFPREMIFSEFELPQLKDSKMNIEYFSINLNTDNRKIKKALQWLIKKII
ncbi:MAG: putative Small GTP-binding domain protein, Arf-domain signature [Promethearchaeota archaeon]|nr:MAG: putative Small GTP-binding domain protein, Arf-domain signature [Candidatus Lokiarchaeota archaeon]